MKKKKHIGLNFYHGSNFNKGWFYEGQRQTWDRRPSSHQYLSWLKRRVEELQPNEMLVIERGAYGKMKGVFRNAGIDLSKISIWHQSKNVVEGGEETRRCYIFVSLKTSGESVADGGEVQAVPQADRKRKKVRD